MKENNLLTPKGDNMTITDEDRASFALMMKDYSGGGGPYIMINLNDLYAEDVYGDEIHPNRKTAATLIRDAVSYEVRNTYKKRIKESVDVACEKFINDELNEEIRTAVKTIFNNGFQTDINGAQTTTTPAEMVVSSMENWFNTQPAGSSYGRNSQVTLKYLIDELVTKALTKDTKELIKDVNRDVLEAAKKSVAQTVTDQLFSGMKLLPTIKG